MNDAAGPGWPLFVQYPRLGTSVAHVTIADLPTPVTRCENLARSLGIGELYIKRDDLSGGRYGGNKVRKLEFLLGQAIEDGAREVLTFGYAGSNHATATAIYSRDVGLGCISMLLPQPNARYVRRNLLASHRAGAELHHYPSERRLALGVTVQMARHRLRRGRFPVAIPPGGSSVQGILGFVNAALELRDQIDRGELPEPDVIYIALGTMGSAVGLMVGGLAAGLKSRIVGVRVTSPRYANREKYRRMFTKTVDRIREVDPQFPALEAMSTPLEIRDEFFGNHYAEFTEAGVAAVSLVKEEADIPLEGTYTGKAFAAVVADGELGRLAEQRVLFWNTHNSRDHTADVVKGSYKSLPRAFHQYFEQEPQPLDRY